jgi:SAM-dependent methyltransferase
VTIEQPWDAASYAANAAFVPAFGVDVLELLAPQTGERILDLGCGDGALTARIADAGARVVGVDTAPDFVAATRARGIDARLVDACALPFQDEFDAVFSNAALHWMREPANVVRGVARALVPGGRFVAEMGGEGNVASIVAAISTTLARRDIDAAARNPWYFPNAGEYAALLESAGFEVDEIALFERPTPLPTGMRKWLETFANPFFGGIGAKERYELAAEIEELLAPALRDADGNWVADYVRLRFSARTRTTRA